MKDQVQKGLSAISGGAANVNLNDMVSKILNWIFGIIGVIAVIMIILGGFYMMTSAGDAKKVAKGKDTILYGVIGLIITILAFAIVNFVLGAFAN